MQLSHGHLPKPHALAVEEERQQAVAKPSDTTVFRSAQR
jgi:hypothetical protein